MDRAQELLDFWFGPESDPAFGRPQARWFVKDPEFDEALRQRYAGDLDSAAAGRLDGWATTPKGALALVLLCDQLPRNLFRGDPRAFATDERAVAAAVDALAAGWDAALPVAQRRFLYMPFMHSESLDDQRRCVALMSGCGDDEESQRSSDYARRHLAIIERFGRFPHRNMILGRTNTPAELEFLLQPGSSF